MKKMLLYAIIGVLVLPFVTGFKWHDKKLRIFEHEEVWFQEYRTEGVVLPDSTSYTHGEITTIYIPRTDEDSD